jgi:phytanoyl-CoA hydroxylase
LGKRTARELSTDDAEDDWVARIDRRTIRDAMAYPIASPDDIAFFREHGWLVVRRAIPHDVLDLLDAHCDELIARKEELAKDWAWDARESRETRSFRIVQASPSRVWPEIATQPYRRWFTDFAAALLDRPMEFWYDQFLGKPPGASAPTEWHQDEGYWGRNLDDRGITAWMPLHDVDEVNGCMHFVDRGHRDGILVHRGVDGVQSDLLTCDVDEGRAVVCPLVRGDVTFHHSKTPHRTNANNGRAWRRAISNHLQVVGTGGEGDPYPWRVKVSQRAGERIVPDSAPKKI